MPSHAVSVELDPCAEFSTCYELSPHGVLNPIGANPINVNTVVRSRLSSLTAVGAAEFTTEAAQDAAALLVGYYLWRKADCVGWPEPRTVDLVPLAPTSRTRRHTLWDLGPGGLSLRFHATAPYPLVLDIPAPRTMRPLTLTLAKRLARALLAGAQELAHATAVADYAVQADRAGESVTASLRAWLDTAQHGLPRTVDGLDALIDGLRTVLADEDSLVREQRRIVAIGRAHGDLRAQLDRAWHESADASSEIDVAWLLTELARRFALPMGCLTRASHELRAVLPEGVELTRHQWTRLARSHEMSELPLRVGEVVDLPVALLQAGVLCRGDAGACGALLHDPVAATWGFCPSCRPDDLPTAIAAGCVAAPSGVRSERPHDLPTSYGACRTCAIPLTPDPTPNPRDRGELT